MKTREGMIYILDDEPEMVKALERLLRAKGFKTHGFTSVREFQEHKMSVDVACLILDVAMPELNGLELQKYLLREGNLIPVLFLTGHGDIPMSVRAIKAGASDFLTKPVDDAALLNAVHAALLESEKRIKTQSDTALWSSRLATLTKRQQEVLELVMEGKLNKQIAAELGTGEQNIKLHRAHIMQKMGVSSVAELVRVIERLEINKIP
jgi:FixJ family two-component response regulator